MGLNRDLLRRVAHSIRANDRRAIGYSQSSYFRQEWDEEGNVCGTVGCVAGHAILLELGMDQIRKCNAADPLNRSQTYLAVGARALGLTVVQATALFDGSPTLGFVCEQFNLPNECRAKLREGPVSPEWMANLLELIADHGSVPRSEIP